MTARTRLVLLLLMLAAALAWLSAPPRPPARPVATREPAPPGPEAPPAPAFVRLGTPDVPSDRSAIFPDGSRFVVVDEDTMRVVDTRTRAVLKAWPIGWREVNFIAVSPDGKRIAYGNGSVRVIDADSGTLLREVAAHVGGANSVAYSPDGRLLLTCGSEVDWSNKPSLLPILPRSSCKVWDAATLTEHPATRGGLIGEAPVWRPDGRAFTYRANVGDGQKRETELRVQPLDGRPAESLALRGAGGAEYTPAAFSPSGRLVVAYSQTDGGAVFDWATRALVLNLDADRAPGVRTATVGCVAADDDTVYSCDGGAIRVRSLAAGGARPFAWQHLPSPQLVLGSDGKALFAHTANHGVLAWDAATGRAIHDRPGHCGPVNAVDISPDGTRVLTGGADATVRVWDRATGRELRAFGGHAAGVYRAAFLADNRTAVSVDSGGAVKLWDTHTGEESGALALGVWSGSAVSPRRDLLAVAFDGRIRFWALPGLAERDLIRAGFHQPAALSFTPDGRALDFRAARSERHAKPPYYTFNRWDVRAQREVVQVDSWPGIELLSPDGETFVGHVGPWGNTALAAWDRASGRELARFGPEHQGWAFSPDGGRLLVSTIRDAHTRKTDFTLYEARTWKPVAALGGHGGMVHAAAFSADGRFLVTGSADTTATVWNLAP